jgi:hypothetical protein
MTESESERFDAGVRRILSVSHDEVKRREERWKRGRAGKAKPGPKPKTSPDARVSEQFGDRRNVLLIRITPQREPQGSTHFIHPCGTKLGDASS